jgi:hypothetical protein
VYFTYTPRDLGRLATLTAPNNPVGPGGISGDGVGRKEVAVVIVHPDHPDHPDHAPVRVVGAGRSVRCLRYGDSYQMRRAVCAGLDQ